MSQKVILYHKIGRKEFEAQLAYLKSKYYLLTVNEYLKGEKGLLITFDDGLLDNYTELYGVILKEKIPAIMFVNPARVGTPGYCTTPQLIALANCGVVIANHGYSHIALAGQAKEIVASEFVKAKEWLVANIKHTNIYPDIFALPKGSEDESTRGYLAEAGVEKVFGSERIDVYPGRSKRYFVWSLNRAFQWLRRNKSTAAIFTLFVVLRLILGLLLLDGIPNIGIPADYYFPTGGDEISYVIDGANIISGKWFSGTNPVAYPALISLVMLAVEEPSLPSIAKPLLYLNLLFSVIWLLLSLALVREFFITKWHLVTTGFALVFMPYIWYVIFKDFTLINTTGVLDHIGLAQSMHLFGTVVLPDWLGAMFATGGLLLILRKRYLLSGLFIGIALLVRSQTVIPIILITLLLLALRHYKSTILFLIGTIPSLLIQGYHNFMLSGSPFEFIAYQADHNASTAIDGIGLNNIIAIPMRLISHSPWLLVLLVSVVLLFTTGLIFWNRYKEKFLYLLLVGIMSPASFFLTAPALRNPRYFLPFLPLFIILTLSTYEWFKRRNSSI